MTDRTPPPASEFRPGLNDICEVLSEIVVTMRAYELALRSQHQLLQSPLPAAARTWEKNRPVILNGVGSLMNTVGEVRERIEASIGKLEDLAAGN